MISSRTFLPLVYMVSIIYLSLTTQLAKESDIIILGGSYKECTTFIRAESLNFMKRMGVERWVDACNKEMYSKENYFND